MDAQAAERPPEETLSLWKREQAWLKTQVVDWDTEPWQQDPSFSGLQRVGGVDVSFVKGDSAQACATLVVLSYPELEVIHEESRMVSLTTPYISGFLAFREVSFLVDLVQRLRETEPGRMPQVLLVDGNGVLHHRGFGVACHLGVLTGLPCVGVAKKLLQVDGLENNAVHKEKIQTLRAAGDTFPLTGDSGTVLGVALRSHDCSSKPLYVSVGHKLSLDTAVHLTCRCCRFRVPEPVRQADIRSREFIRRTLVPPGPPAKGRERSQKVVQGSKEHPKGDWGEDCSRGRGTGLEAPPPGSGEQDPAPQAGGADGPEPLTLPWESGCTEEPVSGSGEVVPAHSQVQHKASR
ncbi:endonuclease V [Thomomys bottae]